MINNFSQHEIDSVVAEAEYAYNKWGVKFDDKNTLNDWAAYINIYVAETTRMNVAGDPEFQYAQLIKAANLALTAAYRVRTKTVAPRHYERGTT